MGIWCSRDFVLTYSSRIYVRVCVSTIYTYGLLVPMEHRTNSLPCMLPTFFTRVFWLKNQSHGANSMSGYLSIRFELVWAFSADGASVQNLYHVVMYIYMWLVCVYVITRICVDRVWLDRVNDEVDGLLTQGNQMIVIHHTRKSSQLFLQKDRRKRKQGDHRWMMGSARSEG